MILPRYLTRWSVLFLLILFSTSIGGCISRDGTETTTIVPTTVVTSVETTVEAFRPGLLEIPPDSDTNQNLIEDSLDSSISAHPQDTFRVIVILKQPLSDDDIQIFESRGGTIEHTYDKAMYGLAGTITGEDIIALKSDYADKLHFISEDATMQLTGEGEVTFRK